MDGRSRPFGPVEADVPPTGRDRAILPRRGIFLDSRMALVWLCRVRIAGKVGWPDRTRSCSPRRRRISPISGACAHRAVRRGSARTIQGDAVPYFYEPFLEALRPGAAKGVWASGTPPSEVVRYMVSRVDNALKDDLGISEGLAAENVYVLDPCCGTGAYPGPASPGLELFRSRQQVEMVDSAL